MPEYLLDADDIARYLEEVAAELGPDGRQHVIVVVGGSLLALHGLREATRDVDSAKSLDAEIKSAVAVVAARHELAPSWLNDSAAGFRPSSLREDECETLLEHRRLVALGAPLQVVFAMKLFANRQVDQPDLSRRRLPWLCSTSHIPTKSSIPNWSPMSRAS